MLVIKIFATVISTFLALISILSLVGGRLKEPEYKAMLFVLTAVLLDIFAIWG